MHNGRVTHIKTTKEIKGNYILYWMQQSQRINYNHALNLSIILSNLHGIPVVVYFGLTDDFPGANLRHYTFMLEGLNYLKTKFIEMGIKFVIYKTSPETGCIELMRNATHLVMDKGYTRIQKQWKIKVLEKAKEIETLNIIEVESDVVVPVELVSDKEEYSAKTIRPKILAQIDTFAVRIRAAEPFIRSSYMNLECSLEEVHAPLQILDTLSIDTGVSASTRFIGGELEARKIFHSFLHESLSKYSEKNHPEFDYCSHLSPYLHFGHISTVEITYLLKKSLDANPFMELSVNAFIEELVIRKELAINFVNFNENYDVFEYITYKWAYDTMNLHENDKREYLYTVDELQKYNTHDIYWNAAMKEMVETGYMHTYMRMYWCKKIIEWSSDYKTAYDTSIYLNNKYFIDGRDPNSYAGIAWCFGKHDRAWGERPIFGKLRYMNANGLKRKFDIDKYIIRINELIGDTV